MTGLPITGSLRGDGPLYYRSDPSPAIPRSWAENPHVYFVAGWLTTLGHDPVDRELERVLIEAEARSSEWSDQM